MLLKSIFTSTLAFAFLLPLIGQAHTMQYFDTMNPDAGFVEICKKNADGTVQVAPYCGRFANPETRNRSDLIERVEELNGFKKNDEVSVYVNRRKGVQVVMMTLSFLFENGEVDAFEYYTAGRGPSAGSIHRVLKVNQLNRETQDVRGIKKGDIVCVRQGFKHEYGFNKENSFNFKAGEQYRVLKVFENGYANLKYEGNPLLSAWNYGSGNKLHVYFMGPQFELCR